MKDRAGDFQRAVDRRRAGTLSEPCLDEWFRRALCAPSDGPYDWSEEPGQVRAATGLEKPVLGSRSRSASWTIFCIGEKRLVRT